MKPTISALTNWAKDNGADISPEIEFTEDVVKGICAVARKELSNAKIKVPENIIISTQLASTYFPVDSGDGNTWLKLFLCKLKFQEELSFGPYIRNLPQTLNSPLVWNPNEWQLLEGTNLGNSLKDKLYKVFTEWYEFIVKYSHIFPSSPLGHDIDLYRRFDAVGSDELYADILQHAAKGDAQLWYSLSAFLWAHLILLSRAFPEYIIHPGCNEGSVILLPLLDLLNHDAYTKVRWYSTNNNFYYEKLETTGAGQEVTNNYGPKGNEELLMGYGFVKECNEFDYVALKIKVPFETLETILNSEDSIQLPSLDDYTTFAFERPQTQSTREKDNILSYKDGVTYFINPRNDKCLILLLELFAYLSKAQTEKWSDLRPRLQGLQALRAALQSKLQQVSLFSDVSDPKTYSIDKYRRHCADIYRGGQRSVLKHSISSIKAVEKSLIKQCGDQLLNLKKIMKSDPRFAQDELPSLFEGEDQNRVSFDDTLEIIVLWVATKVKYDTFNSKHMWVGQQFRNFLKRSLSIEVTQDVKALYAELFPQNKAKVSLDEVNLAYNFVLENTFTRSSSSNETILVRNN
ncbi:related to Ribosomal N-lysine methyltransferase 1 [Zygosaccharomyces bailii ISA1307]|nr:related to Ribosomal N-lysine methyltransferase 1 [Zygosaccharomyces bailii ISA1307]